MTIILIILFLSILIIAHELGHFLAAKIFNVKVEEFGFGFPPKIISKKIGETEYSLNLLPFGGFVKIFGENNEETSHLRAFVSQSTWKKSVMILAGVFMNIILAWFALTIIFTIGIPKHLLIADVIKNSPAASASLKSGDIIIQVSFENVNLRDPVKINEFIELTKNNAEKSIILKIQRGPETKEISVVPRQNPPAGQGPLGIALSEIGISKESFPKNIVEAAKETIVSLKITALSFIYIFSNIFTKPEIIENISGPIGIFGMATAAGEMGIIYLLQLMALISINLAVLNFIPFPALDGGRFLFILLEKIKGSPISYRIQSVINALGFIALLLLMLIVTVKDINSLIK